MTDHLVPRATTEESVDPDLTTDRESGLIEHYTIEAIPASERHGKARDLFMIWFAINVGPLAIVTGALGPQVFGLSLLWSVAAIAVGNLVGAVLMALHSAQGPKLGVPQMIQSRGQFGLYGSLLLIVVVIAIYVGFFASTLVVGAQSIAGALNFAGVAVWTVVGAVVAILIAIFGYDLIHRVGRILTILGVVAYLSIAVAIAVHGVPGGVFTPGTFQFSSFLAMASTAALWQIAFAPYVSDYSRYMPETTAGQQSTFWATYWGCALGSILPMILGTFIAAMVVGSDVLASFGEIVSPTLATVVLLLFGVVTVHINAMNLYGGVLSITTFVQAFKHDWLPSKMTRVAIITVIGVVSSIVAVVSADNFLVAYSNFLILMLCVLTPWTVINLIDYYLVRHGSYDVASFFAPGGGIYGTFNVAAVVTYVAGIVVQIPFVGTAVYSGPLYLAIGADISWIVSAVVAGPLYLVLCRRGAVGSSAPK